MRTACLETEAAEKEYCMEKIIFTAEDGTKEEFYIEEQTRINGELSSGLGFYE